MVLLSDKKYACETCIKGHRSSACKHTDRPLFEIKKKGRPVTQCEHCRELRKTKQVHVKCLCGLQEQGPSTPDPDSGKHATPKVPAVAAFPNGLPEALGALVAPHLHSDGSADSDHSGEQSSAGGCKCNVGGACHCCTPRKPKSRRRSSAQDDKHNSESLTRPVLSHPPPLSSHVLARIAELRPVLPRPSRRDANAVEPLHNPSAGLPHGHGARHHTHDHTLYSPYGRAYEQIHAPEQLYSNRAPILTNETPSFPPPPLNYTADAWPSVEGVAPSACACGDSCRCPGCTLHNNVPIPPGSAYSCCTNPASCTFCLDCTILSMSPNSPNLTDSSTTGQFREFDEWLQQMSASSPTLSHSNSYPLSENLSPMLPYSQPNSAVVATSRPGRQVPQYPTPPSDCCHGQCKCPQGACSCPSDCCGCCQGCECDHHCEETRVSTTFAVSGERGTCCSSKKEETRSPAPSRRPNRVPDFMTMTAMRDGSSPSSTSMGMRNIAHYPPRNDSSSNPNVPSRSSSTSSGSSRVSGPSHGGSPTHSQMPSTSALPSPPPRYPSTQSFGGRPSQSMSGPYPGDFSSSNGSRSDPQFDSYGRYNPSLDAMRFR